MEIVESWKGEMSILCHVHINQSQCLRTVLCIVKLMEHLVCCYTYSRDF